MQTEYHISDTICEASIFNFLPSMHFLPRRRRCAPAYPLRYYTRTMTRTHDAYCTLQQLWVRAKTTIHPP